MQRTYLKLVKLDKILNLKWLPVIISISGDIMSAIAWHGIQVYTFYKLFLTQGSNAQAHTTTSD